MLETLCPSMFSGRGFLSPPRSPSALISPGVSPMRKVILSFLLLSLCIGGASAQGLLPRTGEVLFSRKISLGNTGDQFGRSIDLLGDLDDDGVPDLVVGASHDDDGADNAGAIWILFMNRDRSVRDFEKISQTRAGFSGPLGTANWFGKAVAAIGDLDGDGVEDVAVGAPADTISSNRAVFILLLNTDGTVKASTRIANNAQEFGRAIAPLGDLDGDGVTELAIGDGYGRVYTYYLNPNGSVKSWHVYNDRRGATPGHDSFYGLGLDTIGDVDGDGLLDLAIGDTALDLFGTDSGGFYVSLVGLDGTPKSETVMSPGAPGLNLVLPDYPNFGREIALLSDLDGNGVRDLAIGCSEYWSDVEAENSGAVFILLMNPDGSVLDHRRLSRRSGNLNRDIKSHQEFGISLAPIGDWNGDGIDDLAVGARFDDSGAIYLLMLNDGTIEPPIAAASAAPRDGSSPHTVQFTNASTGTVTGWHWDFGDGSSSTESDPQHTYIDPGTYDVTVTALGPAEVKDARTYASVITVGEPNVSIARFQVGNTVGLAPLTVAFTDTSLGGVTSWSWDFGDGTTSNEADPTHTYTTPGSFVPTLDVNGPKGPATVALGETIVVHPAVRPSAGFTASVTQGTVPLTVAFEDLSSGFAPSVTWNFGDGTTSNERDPVHVYTAPGVYTVTMLVGNAIGLNSLRRTDYIAVDLPPLPRADFEASGPRSGLVPLPITFTDFSLGPVSSWAWDFGDGTGSTEANPSHTYVLSGEFTVSLTVTNPAGSDTWSLAKLVTTGQTIDPRPFDDGINGTDAANGTGWIMYTAETVASRFASSPPSFGNVADHLVAVVYLGGTWRYDTNTNYVPFTPRASDRLVAEVNFGADTALMLEGTSGSVNGIASGYVDGDLNILPNRWNGGTNSGEFGATGSYLVLGGAAPAPAPRFEADVRTGPAPLAVGFTDLSAVAGSVPTSWSWDFGDGSSSSLQHPTHTYPAQGTYTVTLTVGNASGSNTRVSADFIVVEPALPVADFALDVTAGPAPLAVAFTDLSSGTITSWSWDFGDGTTSSLQHPAHTYSGAGFYTPTLTVTNPGGSNTIALPTPIDVGVALPVADFARAPDFGNAPLLVVFSDLSTGDITAWSWDFGDGATSSLQDPDHTFAPGTYLPTLTVTNPSGSDTYQATEPIVVLPSVPVAGFGTSATGGNGSLTVQFSDASTGDITSWTWDFGDGATSSLQSPAHTYTEGTYTVSLTVANTGGSDTKTATDLIVVLPEAPTAALAADTTSGTTPLSVQFSDLSTGDVTSWLWDFGDGASSTLQSPAHTYTEGTFTVSLTVANTGGSDTATATDLIVVLPEAPTAALAADTTSGTTPLSVQFTDISTGDVTSWTWDFGDGASSTLQNPAHTYTEGTYTVSLTVANTGGSDTATATDLIVVLPEAPTAALAADTTSGTTPLAVQFSDLSTGDVTSWAWDFGDGATSSLQSPAHTYTEGTYTVSLTAANTGGSDTATATDLIVVLPEAPTAALAADTTSGTTPLSVQFTDISTGDVTSWTWDFGDGASSTLQNPAHTYTEGTYTVSLTVANTGGSDTTTATDLIVVLPEAPTAALAADATSGTTPLSVQFTDLSTGDVTSWTWDFGDGATSSLQSPAHTYTEGTYTVSLTVANTGGSDTATATDLIVVLPEAPTAALAADTTSGTTPLAVQFSDLSTGDVTSWAWDFGDGATSSLQSPAHTYTEGTYTVSLTVANTGGSDTATATDLIVVLPEAPTAALAADVVAGSAPLSVRFFDLSTGDITVWAWDFGDGAVSSLPLPTHTYDATGTYTVSLTVTNAGGSDTATATDLISVLPEPPVAVLAADVTTGGAPLTVQFSDLSTGEVTGWSWDFGDGTASSLQNPAHTFAEGTHTVALTVTNAGGSDTATELVTALAPAPVADFAVDVTSGSPPLAVQFTDLSQGPITSWSWDFGDGATSSMQHPAHDYIAAASFSVTLVVAGPGGTDSLTQTDLVVTLPSGIVDGSFEDSATGAAPGAPWVVELGTAQRVLPDGFPFDQALPSEGSNWLELSAEGSVAALPPSAPSGLVAPSSGGAGVLQDFRYPTGSTRLRFEAAFLLDGDLDDPVFNDWMSVEVSDGANTFCIYYRDTFSVFDRTSQGYGLPMTKVETIEVDLAQLFPSSDSSTPLRLALRVGNGGDGSRPSRGYVDDVRLFGAASARPYGCGINEPDTLVATSLPRLGGMLVLALDNPLGTQCAGTTSATVFISYAPEPAFPCGTVRPGYGMAVGAPGETLVDWATPANRLFRLPAPLWVGPGNPTSVSIGVPNLPALIGISVFAQGFFADAGALCGTRFALTNGLELELGR